MSDIPGRYYPDRNTVKGNENLARFSADLKSDELAAQQARAVAEIARRDDAKRAKVQAIRDTCERLKTALERAERVEEKMPGSSMALLRANEVDEIRAELARHWPGAADPDFRASLLMTERRTEFQPRNAIGATAYPNIADRPFVDTLMGALVKPVPLVGLATVINTDVGGPMDLSWISSNFTPNGIVAQGATISDTDPAFGGLEDFGTYDYKALIRLGASTVTDSGFPIEQYVTDRAIPTLTVDFGDHLWTGTGSGQPLGLLAGLSTVTAGGASVVTFDDVASLLNAVPAAYRYSGRCTILLSPGAHVDLIEEQPLHDWASGTIHGFRFEVDPGLADPATTTKSVVAGDFRSAYVLRFAPTRVDTSGIHAGFDRDQIMTRIVLRANGTRQVTDAARALVHP